MRAFLLVVGMALLAGCAAPAPQAPTVASPPGSTTTPAPTPIADTSAPTVATVEPTSTPTVPAMEPIEIVHAYAGGEPEDRTFVVPAAPSPLVLHLLIAGQDAAACDAASSVRLLVRDPSGADLAVLDATRTDRRNMSAGECDAQSISAAFEPGTWTVAFEGTGDLAGVVHLWTQ